MAMAAKVKNAAEATAAGATDADEELNDRKKKKKKSGLASRMWSFLVSRFRGGDDRYFEKRLQLIAKEEEAVSARLRRRSQTWRRIIRNLILFSVIAVCYAIITTRSLDLNWKMRALRVLPIFLLPALSSIIYLGLVSFTRMCDRKDQKTLERLRAERQARIDEFKERTNYYVTQQLIQKYDPDPAAKAAAATVLASKLGADSGLKVHLGDESTHNAPTGKSHDVEIVRSNGLQNRKQLHTRSGGKESNLLHYSEKEIQHDALSEGPEVSKQLVVEHQNQTISSANDGGWIARIAALLVGEDPTQSYALICGNCHMHNGLAKKEDFPYITYYCPHCKALNRPKQIDERVSSSNSPRASLSTTVGDVDTASYPLVDSVPTSNSPVAAAMETTAGSKIVVSGSPVS